AARPAAPSPMTITSNMGLPRRRGGNDAARLVAGTENRHSGIRTARRGRSGNGPIQGGSLSLGGGASWRAVGLESSHLALRRDGAAGVQIRRLVCRAPETRGIRGGGRDRRHADGVPRALDE